MVEDLAEAQKHVRELYELYKDSLVKRSNLEADIKDLKKEVEWLKGRVEVLTRDNDKQGVRSAISEIAFALETNGIELKPQNVAWAKPAGQTSTSSPSAGKSGAGRGRQTRGRGKQPTAGPSKARRA